MLKQDIALLLEAADKRSRKSIFKNGQLDTGLLSYAPGESTPDHIHARVDEVFYVISGEGTVRIGDEEWLLKEKEILYSPHGESHGFINTGSADWVVLQVKWTLPSADYYEMEVTGGIPDVHTN